jgi:hypothetical protein
MGKQKKLLQHKTKMAAKKARKKSPAYLKAEQSANKSQSINIKKRPQGSQKVGAFGGRKKGFSKKLYRGGPIEEYTKLDSNGNEYIVKAQITNKDRKIDIEIRINARKARTAYEQYELLNQRLGVDVGAVKERARLLKMTEKD